MEFRTSLVVAVCLCLSGSLSKNLERHISGREDILEILMQRDALQIEKRTSQVTLKPICNFPEDPDVVTVNNNVVIQNSWSQPECNLWPIPVPIDVPSHIAIFPIYTMVHRCLGGTYSRLQECAAATKERIVVKYHDLGTNQEASAIMYNHTACSSDNCIAKPSECNPNTETFTNCHCNCNIDQSHCNSTWQSFNSHACNCDCKFVQQCSLYKEWNPKTCQCGCAKCIRDICTKANYGVHEELCRCTAS